MSRHVRSHKSSKDYYSQDPNHDLVSRRNFIQRGIVTGAMGLLLPKVFLSSLVRDAFAGGQCSQTAGAPGALAQIFAMGGPSITARLLSYDEATVAGSTPNSGINPVAVKYGIVPSDLVEITGRTDKTGIYISKKSPFGMTLLLGPGGSTYTSALDANGNFNPGSTWAKVLAKISLGGHRGAFNADDGAGQNLGYIGGGAGLKPAKLGKDISFGRTVLNTPWATGLPTIGGTINSFTDLENAISFSPLVKSLASTSGNAAQQAAAQAVTESAAAASVTNAAAASASLADQFDALFGNTSRNGMGVISDAAKNGFKNDAQFAISATAAQIFDPTQIPVLANNLPLTGNGSMLLSPAEQAWLVSFYQSAMGQIAGVTLEFGADYHGASGGQIAAVDVGAARSLVLFLAACDLAQTKGAMIMASNGLAICGNEPPYPAGNGATNGVIPGVTTALNGLSGAMTYTVTAPGATGDGGGYFNAGTLLCFDPCGSPPQLKLTGALNSDGSVVTDATVGAGNVGNAMAGLYLSAFLHLGVDTTALAAKIQRAGLNAGPNNILI